MSHAKPDISRISEYIYSWVPCHCCCLLCVGTEQGKGETYLSRHIVKAFRSLKKKLKPFVCVNWTCVKYYILLYYCFWSCRCMHKKICWKISFHAGTSKWDWILSNLKKNSIRFFIESDKFTNFRWRFPILLICSCASYQHKIHAKVLRIFLFILQRGWCRMKKQVYIWKFFLLRFFTSCYSRSVYA